MTDSAGVTSMGDPLAEHLREAARHSRRGLGILLFGLLPVAAWLALAPLTSAVVAHAVVKVDLNRRPVQHQEGGIVREVRVRDGQRVRQGEPLIVLGDVAVDADSQRIRHLLLAEQVGVARLEAEQALKASIDVPEPVLVAAASDPRIAELINKERDLFGARRRALVDQTGLLRTQRANVEQEIVSLRAQIDSSIESLGLQKRELETHRDLSQKGYVSAGRVLQLEATVADYAARIEEHRSELARARQRTTEIDLKINGLEGQYRQSASDGLREGATRLSNLEQEQRKTADASSRQLILAPASGEVIELKYTTPGAVIAPRETIAAIVPSDARLVVEARIRTEDIGRVRQGQPADVRFTAFKYRTTQVVSGSVVYVGGDRLVDAATNEPYYVALVETDAASLAAAGEIQLHAGMPAEVFLKGERRTALEYLLEPVTAALQRAGRES